MSAAHSLCCCAAHGKRADAQRLAAPGWRHGPAAAWWLAAAAPHEPSWPRPAASTAAAAWWGAGQPNSRHDARKDGIARHLGTGATSNPLAVAARPFGCGSRSRLCSCCQQQTCTQRNIRLFGRTDDVSCMLAASVLWPAAAARRPAAASARCVRRDLAVTALRYAPGLRTNHGDAMTAAGGLRLFCAWHLHGIVIDASLRGHLNLRLQCGRSASRLLRVAAARRLWHPTAATTAAPGLQPTAGRPAVAQAVLQQCYD